MDAFQRLVTERLDRIERRQTALLLLVCICIVWLCGLSLGSDITIATLDRQQFAQDQWPYIFYLTCEAVPIEERAELIAAMKFAICSATRAPVIEHQLPTQIAPTLYRIDTRILGWSKSFPKVMIVYPYSHKEGALELMARADWLTQYIMDQTVSGTTYHELLFGVAPKDLNEFKKFLEVTPGSKYEHGFIESASGVSVEGTRLITTTPTAGRFDLWSTFDSAKIAGETDPLEHLDRTQKFDASEFIGFIPKSVAATGSLGHLQVYALANAAGKLQEKAPADIVIDHHGTRGPEIISPFSCVICHQKGLQELKQNAVREFIKSGAEAYADYRNQQEIERFHLSSLQALIARSNEDYAVIVSAVNGLSPPDNALALQHVLMAYDRPLTIEDAARELHCTPHTLKLALGYAGKLPARLAQLAHGGTINRETWELEYRTARKALYRWKAAN